MNLSHMTLGDKVVRLLAHALGDLPDVESLDLSDNNITDASVVPLLAIAMDKSSATGLSPFASLRQLDLSDNNLGTPSALALAAYLGQQVTRPPCIFYSSFSSRYYLPSNLPLLSIRFIDASNIRTTATQSVFTTSVVFT